MDQKQAILNFHGIGRCPRPLEPGEQDVWVDEGIFLDFLRELATHDNCEITFDDGNKSDVDMALPALLSNGLRAKFFVLTGRIGTPGFLDESDIRQLQANGMEIGLHGSDHMSWRAANSRQLDREIDEAKSILERITGGQVTEAACPFGDYGRHTLGRLRSAGFTAVYTSDGGLANSGSWLRPRRTVRSTDSPQLIHRLWREPLSARLTRTAKMFAKKLR